MDQSVVYVYKSLKKQRTYLYLKEKDAFGALPQALLDAFGAPHFVMVFALDKRQSLPKVSIPQLRQALEEKGFFLRIDLDDVEENLLNQERIRNGLPPLEKDKITEFFH